MFQKRWQRIFKRNTPRENDPDWKQDDHEYWESHFKIDGIKYRADYNSDATWVETENSIDKDELPEAVLQKIEEQYSDREITEVEHLQSAKESDFYDVEFKQKGKNMDIQFRKGGRVFKVKNRGAYILMNMLSVS